MTKNRSKLAAESLNIFMNTQSHEDKNKFLQYCINHELVPAEKSLESYKLIVLRAGKIAKLATKILDMKDHSTIYGLIKFVIDLTEEIIDVGDSEGIETETETVLDAQRWIKENIGE